MSGTERSRVLLVALVFGGATFLLSVSGSPAQGTHVRTVVPGGLSAQLSDSVMPMPLITSVR